MKNQILNVNSYQQVVQFAADLVAPTTRKQWYSLPRTDWYSFPRNEWYSLTRILHDDKQNSIVKALKVHDGSPLDIPQVIIGWDDELKYHVVVPDSYKTKAQDRKLTDLSDIARDIFFGVSTISYTNLVAELKEKLGVKDCQAKNYIKIMKGNKII